MRPSFTSTVVALAATCCAALAYQYDKVEIPEGGPDSNSISGKVTDGGSGFPGVTVSLYGKSDSSYDATHHRYGMTPLAREWTTIWSTSCNQHGRLNYVRVGFAVLGPSRAS